jgi:hypothetical protein
MNAGKIVVEYFTSYALMTQYTLKDMHAWMR